MNAEQQSKQWSQIVAKAWADANFKRRLLGEPVAVLKEHGIAVAAGLQVKVVEDTEKERHLTLPVQAEEDEELDEAALGKVVGGAETASTPTPAGGTTIEYKKKTTYD